MRGGGCERGQDRGIWFRLLGPVIVSYAGDERVLRGAQPRSVLAMLLLEPGWVVSAGRLLESLWGDAPPPDARHLVQVHVSRLRSALAGIPAVRLETVGRQGYRLDVPVESVDLHRFRALVSEAAEARDERATVRLLDEALSLWRGAALSGVSGDMLASRVAPALEEERLCAVEARVAARMRLGEHRDVVPELSALLAEHPTREGAAGALMAALRASGRTDEALGVYRDLRSALVDELGIEPSAHVQELHQAILEGRALDTADRGPVVRPAQLPPDVVSFVGRSAELRRLEDALDAATNSSAVAVVTGLAGAGKTALVVHAGHLARSRFPDGQLYAHLAGTRRDPADAAEVLAGFLTALGIPDHDIPGPVTQRVALYRSALAGRRVLVVLDDTRDAEQVRPLVPAAPGCAALVSSRSALAGLDAVARVELGALDRADALGILTAEVDPPRLRADPEAVDAILDSCGQLALALRIAARRLATRPRWSVRSFADQLVDVRDRLDQLTAGDLSVRRSIELTYRQLDEPTASVFCSLGLVEGPDIATDEAAALLDTSEREARRMLDSLDELYLVESSEPRRFRMHDLLRAFAREQAETDLSERARAAAVARLAGSYAASLRNATGARTAGVVLPEFDLPGTEQAHEFEAAEEATRWLHREHSNLAAAVRSACAAGVVPAMVAGRIANLFGRYADPHGRRSDLAVVTEAAIDRARAEGDRVAEGIALISRGVLVLREYGRLASLPHTRAAAELLKGSGLRAEASALNNIAVCTNDAQERQDCLERATEVYEALGDERGTVTMLGNVADHYYQIGDYERAIELAREAAARARHAGAPDIAAGSDLTVAESLQALGRTAEALPMVRRILDTVTGESATLVVSMAAASYARMLRESGRPAEAVDQYEHALTALRALGARHDVGTTMAELGDALDAVGQRQRAEACWRSAGDILTQLGAPEADSVRDRLAATPPR